MRTGSLATALVAGALLGLLLLPRPAEGRGGWPDLDFVYSYEANAGEDAYVAADNTLGCLDGAWRRSDNSDEWNGSTPTPGDGLCPGGVDVELVAGEGEGGGDASVLSLEDVGDPRNTGTCPNADPSNRKIFLWRNTTSELNLVDGITLQARWRLNPAPRSLAFANNGGAQPVPNGTHLHDQNKGQIGFVQKTATNGGVAAATLALALTDGGHLQFGQAYNNTPCAGTFFPAELCLDVDQNEWQHVWMTAREEGGQVHAKVFLNGSLAPAIDVRQAFRADAENANLVETGGVAASYINIALGSTGQTGAIQVDYVCVAQGFIEPAEANPNCPAGLEASAAAGDVTLSWTNGDVVPAGVDIFREDVLIADNAAADPPSFTDQGVPAGAYDYRAVFDVPGNECPDRAASIDLCPRALTAQSVPAGVELRFEHASASSIVVSRDDVVIETLGPGVTSYVDSSVVTSTAYRYSIRDEAGACAPLSVMLTHFAAPGEGTFAGLPVAWEYCLDPPPAADRTEYLRSNPERNQIGDLDGGWASGSGSDSWDGSAPGEVGNPALDVLNQEIVGAEAPGGIGLVTAGEVGAYLIEDAGNPESGAPPTGGWLAPSNAKIYLGYDLGRVDPTSATRSWIRDGMTFYTRFRLSPSGQGVDVAAPDGYRSHNGAKSIFSLVHHGTADPSQRLSFALDTLGASGALFVSGLTEGGIVVPIPDPTEWLDLWVTVRDADGNPATGELALNVYLNGSFEPTVSLTSFLPNAGGREADIADAQGVSLNPVNLIYMGLGSTADSGSVQVDSLCVHRAVVAPGEVGPPPPFRRGDANDDGLVDEADANFILAFASAGGPEPTCRDAADVEDDGDVDANDGIYLLTFLAQEGPPPPAPYPSCAVDPTDTDAQRCREYTSCGADSDGDGVFDDRDNCVAASNPGQEDADADGAGDLCDNCVAASNPGQEDTDADGAGDLCDNCVAASNPGQEDTDADGAGDLCDNCVAASNPGQEDTDADGVGDACDVPEGPMFVRGDADGSGDVPGATADMVRYANVCFLGTNEFPCRAAADFDGDGQVCGAVTDIVYLANFLFLGSGPPPPAPFPGCALGNERDAVLGCASHPCLDG